VKRLKVMGMRVSVVEVHQADGVLGSCAEKMMQIELDPHLTPELRIKTLIHELTHLYSSALGFPSWGEKTVTAVENIIWLLLTENPGIMKEIQELR
jgi:hypothetical protein